MNVFALSDIHIDYSENRNWLLNLSSVDYRDDIIVFSGDISDEMSAIDFCFKELSKKFKSVVFVPGNHELWVSRQKGLTSIDKFKLICSLAEDRGIYTRPLHTATLSIVPLLGWYDYSFGQPNSKLLSVWMDFRSCSWPHNMQPPDITQYFIEKNESFLGITNQTVISCSHFLPRIDLMPSFIPHAYRYLYPVLGTEQLEIQIRGLMPDIHIYGHSHVNRHTIIDGINYAFGYPLESRIAAKKLLCVHQE